MTLKASPGGAVEKTFPKGQAVLNPKNAGGAGQAGRPLPLHLRGQPQGPPAPGWVGKAIQTARGLLGNSLQGRVRRWEVKGEKGERAGAGRELAQ